MIYRLSYVDTLGFESWDGFKFFTKRGARKEIASLRRGGMVSDLVVRRFGKIVILDSTADNE